MQGEKRQEGHRDKKRTPLMTNPCETRVDHMENLWLANELDFLRVVRHQQNDFVAFLPGRNITGIGNHLLPIGET